MNLLDDDEYFLFSKNSLLEIYKNSNSGHRKNLIYATDNTIDLPIRMKKTGHGSNAPITLVDIMLAQVLLEPETVALQVKRNKIWIKWTYKQYFEDACNFAKACMVKNITPNKSVNICGFNAPEWNISFYGSILGSFLPVGVYTTNQKEACQYLADHSDCEMIVLENMEILQKYIEIWDSLGKLKLAVIYDQKIDLSKIPQHRQSQIMSWNQFLQLGKNSQNFDQQLQNSMLSQTPGKCCTLVYTSGTTGPPKGVMLSHDNYTWTSYVQSLDMINKPYDPKLQSMSWLEIRQQHKEFLNHRIVSYLPLSHVAAQIIDIIGAVMSSSTVFFAEPTALQGSLVETLKEVQPTFFMGVPRVWEKIQEKMSLVRQSNPLILNKISDYAKSIGVQGTYDEINKKQSTVCFQLSKLVVFNNVKKALGLSKAQFLIVGAAPFSESLQQYFLSLNLMIQNTYGMSESSGPQTMLSPFQLPDFTNQSIRSCGTSLQGTDLIIFEKDENGEGEICFKGRNRFMGYYKNEEATIQTIDEKGFLHSGDIGKLNKLGDLVITGRKKELIITAGGENIAPVLIENEIITELGSFISQAVVIGEQKKYLIVLLAIKQDENNENLVSQNCQKIFKNMDLNIKTIFEAKQNQKLKEIIQMGIDKVNSRAISKAQHLRKWLLLDREFSIKYNEITPTMKLKRKEITKNHQNLIDFIYQDAKL